MDKLASTDASLAPAAPADTPPTAVQRWVAFVPLALTFLVVTTSTAYSEAFIEVYRELNLDLPTPTIWALNWHWMSKAVYGLWLPAMLGIAYLHFTWGSTSLHRMTWLSILWTFLLFIALLILAGWLVLPLFKMQCGPIKVLY